MSIGRDLRAGQSGDAFWRMRCETAISNYTHKCIRKHYSSALSYTLRLAYPAKTCLSAVYITNVVQTYSLPCTRSYISTSPNWCVELLSDGHGLHRTYREEVMSILIVRFQIHYGSRPTLWSQGFIHHADGVVTGPREPHWHVAGTCLCVSVTLVVWSLRWRLTVMMTRLYNVEGKPVCIRKLRRR